MSKFEYSDFTKFVANYSIKNGELVDEFALNLSPQRIKKELNNIYNITNMLNGKDILSWDPIEDYLVGELCQNTKSDNKYYRARKVSSNKRPDLFPDLWEIARDTDYTTYGGFSNYLAKNNTIPYSPKNQFNPTTKGYVDFENSKKLNVDGKASDSAKLNGQIVANTLSNSTIKPASVKLVKTVNDKIGLKLDASEFTATNIMSMVQNKDGIGSGLDADKLDGLSSEFYMKVGNTTNFNTMKTPGSYLVTPGGTGAPNNVDTFAMIVVGNGNYKTQIATSVTSNTLYFRSYVGSWTAWSKSASSNSNVGSADKLSNSVSIGLSGDVTGSALFDGSKNISINSQVKNDSHTHDTRYYTKYQADNKYLGINSKSKDSILFNGLDTTQFVRSNQDTIMNASYTITGMLNVSKGAAGGIHFPVNAYGGTGDSANITLENPNGGEATELSIIVTNDANDIVHVKTPANTGFKHNGNTVWTQGNDGSGSGLDADLLDGHNSSANNVASTVVVRNGSGDINARLFRSEYDTSNSNIGYIMTQVDTNTNNYIRPSTPAQLVNGLPASNLLTKIKTVDGSGSGLDADLLDGHNSSVSATANTVVVRDGNGNINGTSSSAKYADLAEMYSTKEKYSVGTLVQISSSDNYDIEENTNNIFGVISDKPGFILDKGVDGLPVAMVGKTPVRVIGKIKKGDKITDNGCVAKKALENDKFIGIALENKTTENETLIKCFVQVQL